MQQNKETIEFGSILVSYSGCSMILVSFYKVIKISNKSLIIKELCSKIVENAGYLAGYAIPDKLNERSQSESFRVYKRDTGNKNQQYISNIGGYRRYFEKWSGKPEYFNHAD